MKSLLAILCSGLVLMWAAPSSAAGCPDTLDFDMKPLAGGESVNLCESYLGKVVMVVNTASFCAYTPQYEGLEALYDRYKDRGFVVIGFPSNDFGAQEPGTEKQIQDFCRLTYGVRFPMFQKTHAAADRADPIYRVLAEKAGEYPRWNFHKYLLDRRGRLVGSFQSAVKPQSPRLVDAIEKQL